MSPVVHVVEDIGGIAGQLLLDAIRATVDGAGVCTVAVAGGSTPEPALRWLAAALALQPDLIPAVRWTVTDERHLTLADEADWRRWPAGSNLRLLAETVLEPTNTPMGQVVPLCDGGSLDADASAAAEALSAWGAIDVLLIGAGPDGHIASLFPAHPGLEAEGLTVVVRDSPKPPSERVSLTLPFLATARTTVLLATGAAKAPALARSLHGDRGLPLGRFRPTGDVHWVLDAPAASMLET